LNPSGTVLSGPRGIDAGKLTFPDSIAIDASSNVWTTLQNGPDPIFEFSQMGKNLSGSGGFPISAGLGAAIDSGGNFWSSSGGLVKVSPAGAQLSPTFGYSICGGPGIACQGGVIGPAIDGAGNAWSSMQYSAGGSSPAWTVIEMNNTGSILSGSSGYQGGGTFGVQAVAVDGSGNVWALKNFSSNTISQLVGVATPVVTPFSVGIKNGTLATEP
jgi:hypothetical protein